MPRHTEGKGISSKPFWAKLDLHMQKDEFQTLPYHIENQFKRIEGIDMRPKLIKP